MNTYPGIITSRRTRRNLRHFRLLPINPPTESAVQFRAARALNQLSSHASLLVGKWRRHCRNSTNYQHHIWRPEKISNSVTLFAVRPIIEIISIQVWHMYFKCLIIVTSSTCLIIEHVFLRCGFHSCLDIAFSSRSSRHTCPSDNKTQPLSMYIFHFQAQDQLKKL